MKRKEVILLFFIVLGAIIVRLYQFQRPVADWHSWRQVDTSSVSRNFVKNGFDILHPTFHDLSKGVSLLDNPHGYRYVEFPIYNVLQAGFYSIFDYFTIEEWGRLVAITASVISIVFIFLLTRKYISNLAAFSAAFFFAFLPYNIYYGRTLLPDQLTVSFMLASLYVYDWWLDRVVTLKKEKTVWLLYFAGILLTAGAILMKPYVLFFGLSYVYLAWRKFGFRFLTKKELWIFFIFSTLPFILWRLWMLQYPEGIPQSNWLFNGNGIRFKGAFFRWIFAERIGHLILGYFGLPFVVLGIMTRARKEGLLFLSLLVSSFIYLNVLATGNVQHDYYQIMIMPMLAIFFGKGIDTVLYRAKDIFNPFVSYITVIVSILLMLSLSWYSIRDFYNLQHNEVLAAGDAIDRIAPKDAKVIAPYGGDTTFLYYTNRQGWPVVDRPFYEFIDSGAQYIVFAKPTSSELNLGSLFTVVEKGPEYIIFDLTKPTEKGKTSMELERKKDKGGK